MGAVQARYVLGCLAGVFMVCAALRIARGAGRVDPASRTWLLIAVIFGVVSLWLTLSRRR